MILAFPTILLSSWPEWLACVIVIGAVIAGRKVPRGSIVAILLAVPLAWYFGSAGGLLIPLSFGAVVWITFCVSMKRWQKPAEVFAILCSLATAALCGLFPEPVPLRLEGNYPTGTATIEIAATGGKPRLLAQLWYPSLLLGHTAPVSWLPDPFLAPEFPYHRLRSAQAHSRTNAPVVTVDAPLPVIFYEHSWAGHRAENIVQVESLASQGFVVVAVDHPGQAKRVRYADGSIITGRYTTTPELTTPQDVAEFKITAARCFSERSDDIERVRSALKGGAAASLTRRLNLDRVGVFGFSFGGSCAIHLCATDPVFVAGANEDGFYLFDEVPKGSFLFLDEETPAWLQSPPTANEDAGQLLIRSAEARILTALKQPRRERVILDGTRHLSFSDRIYASPIPRLARVGWRPPGEVHKILDSRLTGFFKAALRAETTPE